MEIEEITHEGKLLALFIRRSRLPSGVHFYTPDDAPLQVGQHQRPAGARVHPHRHCPVKIDHEGPQPEVLYVEEGRVRTIFYDDAGNAVAERTLGRGDILLLIEGGHGFEFLEETRLLEIKQGPYLARSRADIQPRGG